MDNLTIRDISRLANVSTATVSRVLTDSAKVKPQTRNTVMRIVEEYGYEPNHIARSLSTSRTHTIGLVVETTSNPYFIQIAQAVEKELNDANLVMLTMSTNWDMDRELTSIKTLRRNRVDGVLLTPISLESESLDLLRKWRLPFVLLNIDAKDENLSSVGTNDVKGGTLAARALLNSGASTLICLQGFPHQSTFARIAGFRETVDAARNGTNERFEVIEDVRTFEEGYKVTEILINHHLPDDGPLGVFATNDDVALGVLASLFDHGISVPQQVAVVGYDDIPMSGRFQIPLTTIAQPTAELGRLAAREIIDQLKGPRNDP